MKNSLSRRQFLAGLGASAGGALAMQTQFLQSQSKTDKLLGINMTHFEWDFDVMNDEGVPQPALIKQFANDFSVVRFLNWQKINMNWMQPPPTSVAEFWGRETREDWRDPPLHAGVSPPSIDWARFRGVPLKFCLKFARELGVRPWVLIPHGGSVQAYSELMQTIVDLTLDGTVQGLKPIFEFSNEIWNSGFGQQREVAKLWLGRDPANGSEQFRSALSYQQARTNELADYVGDRAEVVISAQANNPFVAQTLLAGLSENVDGLAIAPYFGQPRDQKYTRPDVLPNGFHPLISLKTGERFQLNAPKHVLYDQLMENVLGYINAETYWSFREHRKLLDSANSTRQNKLYFACYECGPDFFLISDNNPAYEGVAPLNWAREFYNDFNRTPQAAFLVKRVRDLFFSDEIGGHLLNGYSSGTVYKERGRKTGVLNYDTFGFLELYDEFPRKYRKLWKYDALTGNLDAKKLRKGTRNT